MPGDKDMVWVYWGSLKSHPGTHCERLLKVDRSTLPDGVGHPTRAAARAHRRRRPNAPPVWRKAAAMKAEDRVRMTAIAWRDLAGMRKGMVLVGGAVVLAPPDEKGLWLCSFGAHVLEYHHKEWLPDTSAPANWGIWLDWASSRIDVHVSQTDEYVWVTVEDSECLLPDTEDDRGSIGHAEHLVEEGLPLAHVLLEAVMSWLLFRESETPVSGREWWRDVALGEAIE